MRNDDLHDHPVFHLEMNASTWAAVHQLLLIAEQYVDSV